MSRLRSGGFAALLSGLAAVLPALTARAETGPAEAAPQSVPDAHALLTVSGLRDGTPAVVAFDMAALSALPQVSFTTSTIWTEGPQTFTGVPLGAVLAAAGMTGRTLQATAANDYAVQIPVETWPRNGPVIAYLRNGKPMTLRDKGPLWIVYPYDSDPAYRSEVIYTRSIWQLERIAVQP